MINLIPMPKKISEKTGKFVLTEKSTISTTAEFSGIIELARDQLGYKLKESDKADIRFEFDATLPQEHYNLTVTPHYVRASAGSFSGAFYALQTLRQLLEADGNRGAFLCSPCVEIENDGPRYGWRGLMLDESRHFFGKESVKKLLDYMAMYKLNVFHWHLSDDQGWRIEIKKYPLLTEIGSKRKGSQLHSWCHSDVDYTPYGGFYTQDDIREIVEYAQQRAIMIVPEIDFPAHSAAVLAAYSQLACRDIKSEVFWFFGGKIPAEMGEKDWNRPLCLGKQEVYDFVFDVIDEVAQLFPAPYFHVGGDEAPTDEWRKCPDCQAKIRAEGLVNERELQAHFTNILARHLREKGKKLIGWNEILEGKNISSEVIAQYWTYKSDSNVLRHLENGGKVLLSKHQAFYYDMPYYQVPVSSTYRFEYKPLGIDSKFEQNILGVEAELWAEWLENFDRVEFCLFPRILALSENAWTAQKARNWNSFLARAEIHKEFFKQMNVVCADDEIALKRNLAWKKAKGKGLDFKSYSFEYDLSMKLKQEK